MVQLWKSKIWETARNVIMILNTNFFMLTMTLQIFLHKCSHNLKAKNGVSFKIVNLAKIDDIGTRRG